MSRRPPRHLFKPLGGRPQRGLTFVETRCKKHIDPRGVWGCSMACLAYPFKPLGGRPRWGRLLVEIPFPINVEPRWGLGVLHWHVSPTASPSVQASRRPTPAGSDVCRNEMQET